MIFPIAAMMLILVFAGQLVLCFHVSRGWIKGIPLYLIGVGVLACAAAYFLFDHIYGAAFAAVIYGVLLLILLLGDALAWLIYIVIRKQKLKNKSL